MLTSPSTTVVHRKRSVRSGGWRLLLCLLIALSTLVQAFSAAPAQGQEAEEGSISSTIQFTGFTPGVVLVGLQPGANIQNLVDGHTKGNLLDRLIEPGARYQAVEPVFGAQAASRLQAPSLAVSKLDRIYRLRLAPGTDVLATVEELRAHPGVEFAEPDYIATAGRVPDDPQYGSQWALAKVNAPAAWDVNTGSGTPFPVIAIVDSGLDIQHADLKDRIWTNTDEKAGNGLDDDGNGKIDDVHGWNFLEQSNDVMDENGHGTQVAGVAAATANNGVGISGMCWSCLLMPVKVMQSSGSVNYSDIASAVAYAAAEEADVINLSLGGYADSQTLLTAIEAAAATAVIVAGAGNDGKTAPFYPAAYPEVIAVAASNDTDVKSSFSNYGSWVDASSPGENILTTLSGGNAYGAESGTSLSAPLVAGLAGLLKSQHPDWSPALIRQQIIKTGASIGAQNPNYKGLLGNRIDAGAALGGDPQPELAITRWTVDGSANAQPAPGQTFELRLAIQNTWLPARSLSGTLSETDSYATVKQAAGSFGDLNTGQSATNTDTPFLISLATNTPYSRTIPFTLKLTGQDGYSYTLNFSLSVRSGIEEIPGGTTYIENTTWTSDKTYVLKGNVVVDPGVTLTIQPGTHISVNAGSWLRVDGTLIAAGTAQNPITITTSNADGAQWSGLRFTDTSGAAVFDANKQYLTGSILRYVNISGAETAVSALSRAPFIIDSTFEDNDTAVSSGASSASAGLLQIERSSFHRNGTSISINGGQARINDNSFTENTSGITANGSLAIIGNSFTENRGPAININSGMEADHLVIRDNRLIRNWDGMYINGSTQIEIEHNLLAFNNFPDYCQSSPCPLYGEAAIRLTVVLGNQSTLASPALAYNPEMEEYLLLWAESNTIRGMRMDADGQVVQPGLVIGAGHAPSIVYNPKQEMYFAAWTTGDGLGGEPGEILAQHIAPNGQSVSSNPILIHSGRGENVYVIHEPVGNSYLIVWEDSSIPRRIFARRIKADGTPSGNMFRVGSNADIDAYLNDVSYDSTRQRAFVLLEDAAGPKVYGAWITTDNTKDVMAFELENHCYSTQSLNALAYGAEVDRYLWAWQGQANSQVLGQILQPDATAAISSTLISADTGSANNIRIAFNPVSSQFLAIWSQSHAGEYWLQRIIAQMVAENGTKSGAPVTFSDTGSEIHSLELGYNSTRDEYLVVWVDNRLDSPALYGQRITAAGQLLDNPWSKADETNPAVNFRLEEPAGVRNNTIIHNSGNGLMIGGNGADQVIVRDNNWLGNGYHDVYSLTDKDLDLTDNYWGDIPSSQIAVRIYDCNDTEFGCGSSQTTVGRVLYNSPLGAPAHEAPAFVRSVDVTPDPLGLEQGVFEVTFSRPMTATLPTMSFHESRDGQVTFISREHSETPLQVSDWGLDYPIVDNGRWLSDTQYQATYTVTPIVPKGSYTVEVTEAAGTDDIEIPPDTSKTFLIDYAGYVSDGTPPSRPTVTIQNSGSLTSLTLSWRSTDPEGISQYQYALGTKPGGQDVVSWKYVPATTTSVTLKGLMLTEGQTYYATVAAQNASGLWSENGVSAPLIGGIGAMQQNFLPMVRK